MKRLVFILIGIFGILTILSGVISLFEEISKGLARIIVGILLLLPFYYTTTKKYKDKENAKKALRTANNERLQSEKEQIQKEKEQNIINIKDTMNQKLNVLNIDYAILDDSKPHKIKYKEYEYVTGHPEISVPRKVNIGINKDKIVLFFMDGEIPNSIGEIPLSAIENITSEDKSTIERKVSTLDVLAYGSMGKAMAKDVKVIEYYVLVNWKQGKFTHETIFSFNGKNAITEANIFKSELIKKANEV